MSSEKKNTNENVSENLIKKLAQKISVFEMYEIYRNNNIDKQRFYFFKNIILELGYLVYSTYLGRNYIKTDADILGHYNWCYNTLKNRYLEQEVNIDLNREIYDFFFEHYRLSLYTNTDIADHDDMIKIYHLSEKKTWSEYFDYDKQGKTWSHMHVIIDIYSIFNVVVEKKIS